MQISRLILFMLLPALLMGCHPLTQTVPQNEEIIDQDRPGPTEEKSITTKLTSLTIENFYFEKPQHTPQLTSLKIFKSIRTLELYGDGVLLGRFKIALGGSPEGDKKQEGDSKTPEGQYFICTRNNRSRFTLFLGLSYPNIEDGKRGLENGLINNETFDIIKRSIENDQQPPWNTPLGGAVGIHGKGNSYDWTLGCVALSDEDITILWDYTPLGTMVEIFP